MIRIGNKKGEQIPFLEAWFHVEHPLLIETMPYQPILGLTFFIISKVFLYGNNLMMAMEIVTIMALAQKFEALANNLEVSHSRKDDNG